MLYYFKREDIIQELLDHALRLAVTGKPVGPGVYDCLAILGKDACLVRMERTLAKIG